MPSYRAEAIVLRTHKLGEADRIITLLTRDRGRVRAVAKGVRRTRSKFGARLEPFSRVDLLIHEGKTLDTITQAESLSNFGQDLGADYGAWTVGQTILETAERLATEENVSVEAQYLLLVGALRTLVAAEHSASQVLNSYLLRAMSLAGYAPALDICVMCQQHEQHLFFHVASGGAVCVTHRMPGSVSPSDQAWELLQALMQGNWAVVDAASASCQAEVSGIIAAYVQWHLERGLRSLPLVDRS